MRITLDPVDGMVEITDDDLFFSSSDQEGTVWLAIRETEIKPRLWNFRNN